MTPTQLRAYSAVVRRGSVKLAGADLGISDAAVSLHVASLRKELGDKLFVRTSSGLAFTPGGLRLATRAVEMLGLADRTIQEVSQAGGGRRLLRVAASSLFAEHAAPGLIELFTSRADDLDLELVVTSPRRFVTLLETRSVDAAIGPRDASPGHDLVVTPFLKYHVVVVAGVTHPLATTNTPGPVSLERLREEMWLLGPAAAGDAGAVHAMLRRIRVPEERQRIFQSDSAALAQTRRGHGLSLALSFVVATDLAERRLVKLSGPGLQADGVWNLTTLGRPPSAAGELRSFVVTPRATQAMLRGSGVHITHFKPSVHVTLWS